MPLLHVPWHGWTPTDLIFPFFLFMVGMSLTFSRRTGARPAFARALKLIGLGLLMALYPYTGKIFYLSHNHLKFYSFLCGKRKFLFLT